MSPNFTDDSDDEPKTTAADVIIDNQAEILSKLNKIIDYNRQILAAASRNTNSINMFDYHTPESVDTPEEKQTEKDKSRTEIWILSGILIFLLLIAVAFAVYFYRD